MKKIYSYLLLPVILLLQLNSVAAKENLTNDPKTQFSAKVDGKVWEGGVVSCSVEISSMEFFAMGTDNTSMKILLNSPAGEGTFEISKKSKHKASYGSAEDRYTIGEIDAGKVIITKYDAAKKMFAGTFEFTLTNEKTGKKVKVTDGVFSNMTYSDKPANDFELKAKLNGAKWKWMAATYNVSRDTAYFVGIMDSDKYLHVKFPQNTPPGEYNITADGAYFAEYKSLKKSNDAGLLPKTGKLIILKNDAKKRMISGRFEIEMIDTNGNTKAVFTDGSFTMFYTNE